MSHLFWYHLNIYKYVFLSDMEWNTNEIMFLKK